MTDEYKIDGTVIAEKDGSGNFVIKNIDSLDTDEINNAVYAKQFSGSGLGARIQSAVDAGNSVVRVEQSDTNYDWQTNATLPDKTTLIFEDRSQRVDFEGASGGTGTDDVALTVGQECSVLGGNIFSTRAGGSWDSANPWTCIDLTGGDLRGSFIFPRRVQGFEVGIDMTASGAVASNHVKVMQMFDCRRGLIVSKDGTAGAFARENVFSMHQINYSAMEDGTEIGVVIDDDNNRFDHCRVENYTNIGLELRDGGVNEIRGLRLEGSGTDVASDADTGVNYAYGVPQRYTNLSKSLNDPSDFQVLASKEGAVASETPQDVTSNRSVGTTETNNTQSDLLVSAYYTDGGGGRGELFLQIDGNVVDQNTDAGDGTNSTRVGVTGRVPPGSNYTVDGSGITGFFEQRIGPR